MKKTLVGNVLNGRQHGLAILDGWVDLAGQLNYLNTAYDPSNTDEPGIMVVTFQWVVLDSEYDPSDGNEFQWYYDTSVGTWTQGVPSKIMP